MYKNFTERMQDEYRKLAKHHADKQFEERRIRVVTSLFLLVGCGGFLLLEWFTKPQAFGRVVAAVIVVWVLDYIAAAQREAHHAQAFSRMEHLHNIQMGLLSYELNQQTTGDRSAHGANP